MDLRRLKVVQLNQQHGETASSISGSVLPLYASVYIQRLFEAAKRRCVKMLLGCDAKAHHTQWAFQDDGSSIRNASITDRQRQRLYKSVFPWVFIIRQRSFYRTSSILFPVPLTSRSPFVQYTELKPIIIL